MVDRYIPSERDLELSVLELQHAVFLLASDPEGQTSYLERYGYSPSVDELILEFEPHYIPGTQWEFHRLLSAQQMSALADLSKRISEMDEDPRTTWEIDELDLQKWGQIRTAARRVLETFGLPWGPGVRDQLKSRWPEGWQRDL